eukprot:COSAG01_NODE_821_length_13328_cov_2.385441_9_plen_107_part_00
MKPNASAAVGTGCHSDPSEYAIFVAIFLPLSVMPADLVSGDKLKSLALDPVDPCTSVANHDVARPVQRTKSAGHSGDTAQRRTLRLYSHSHEAAIVSIESGREGGQ